MNTKIYGVALLLAGVLVFAGAGCGNQNVIDAEKQTGVNPPVRGQQVPDTIATESPDKFYNSVEEISSPNALAGELKSILGEACGGAKLTIFNHNLPTQGTDELIYVWKNKPTEEALIGVFEKNGYKIEFSGGIGIAEKGNSTLSVDWYYQLEDHEIVILAGWGEE